MIRQVIISGGLGNQMFQYAFFKGLQSKNKKSQINTCLYNATKMHNGYMLRQAFGIRETSAFSSCAKLGTFITRLIRKYKCLPCVYNEQTDIINEQVFSSRCIFFNGCWINEMYFANIKDKVRDAFSFKGIDQRNLVLAYEMKGTESVSIHVRRGDYLLNEGWCICQDTYYKNAIKYIKEHISRPKFYIFTDDFNWCKDFFSKLDIDYTIVDFNSGKDCYKDMYLMTHCKHNIIANSTFSWWGAWLNENGEKIVICPKKWLLTRTNTPYLESWIKIDFE